MLLIFVVYLYVQVLRLLRIISRIFLAIHTMIDRCQRIDFRILLWINRYRLTRIWWLITYYWFDRLFRIYRNILQLSLLHTFCFLVYLRRSILWCLYHSLLLFLLYRLVCLYWFYWFLGLNLRFLFWRLDWLFFMSFFLFICCFLHLL